MGIRLQNAGRKATLTRFIKAATLRHSHSCLSSTHTHTLPPLSIEVPIQAVPITSPSALGKNMFLPLIMVMAKPGIDQPNIAPTPFSGPSGTS